MDIVFVRVLRVPRRRTVIESFSPRKMNGSLGITRGAEQHPQRFADYFVICGLDKDSGLEPDKYFGESLYVTNVSSETFDHRQRRSFVIHFNISALRKSRLFVPQRCFFCILRGLQFSKSLGCATIDNVSQIGEQHQCRLFTLNATCLCTESWTRFVGLHYHLIRGLTSVLSIDELICYLNEG